MRPLIAVGVGLTLLSACAEEPAPAEVPTDDVPLSELPPAFQQIVGAHTAMMRRGLYERPARCVDFRVPGYNRELSWSEVARLLDSSLGERAGTITTVSSFDREAGELTIRSESISSDLANNVTWTVRSEDGADCVASVELAEASK